MGTGNERRPRLREAATLLAALLLAPAGARAAVGGPDGFGYSWRDGAEPDLDFAWEPPSAGALDITAAGDDINLGFQQLSFPFPYYGGAFTQVAVCSNGWVSPVDDQSTSLLNGPLPAAGGPAGTIAVFWDDLVITDGVSRVLLDDLGDRAIITFENMTEFSASGARHTFQVLLHADGRITVQYLSMNGDLDESTLGIESPDEVHGLTVFNDVPGGVPPGPHVVEFSPPVPRPNLLDCASATPVACGQRIPGDLADGQASQDGYLCSLADFSGREQIYRLGLAAPTDVRLALDAISGTPQMIVLGACDPNGCLSPPGRSAILTGTSGDVFVVVDCAPGEEGAYRLRIDCLPIPSELDCLGAGSVSCGDRLVGDTSGGQANQHAYDCSLDDFSGREDVHVLSLAAPTDLRLALDVIDGNPSMIVLPACDPSTCLAGPGRSALLSGVTGDVHLVIDSAEGDEGSYQLRIDCLPIPNQIDCSSPAELGCGTVVSGDLATGAANQHAYGCTGEDLAGSEHVYFMTIPPDLDVTLRLTEITGQAEILVLDGCDPNACSAPPGDVVSVTGDGGTVLVLVDSPPGQEGEYELEVQCLADSFTFCEDAVFESDPWGDGNGSWLVYGWFWHSFDTHDYALRVDGGTTYSTDSFDCTRFPTMSGGTVPPDGPGLITWGAPEGRVDVTVSPTSEGGCCGLLVEMEVTNTDTVAHSYEFRAYHDTAFGDGNGTCTTNTVDGGPIRVAGNEYLDEVELLPLGADTCRGQVQMASAEDPTGLRASYQMLPPNLPVDMEFIRWDEGGDPCTTWNDLVSGDRIGECLDDNSLLLIWRFPAAAGLLEPGESATASYRIGWECAFPCDLACEDPVLSTGQAADSGPCNDGIRLDWVEAVFPGAGNGRYHVYRSLTSFSDALARPPVSPPGGLTDPFWLDRDTSANAEHYYVVQAESTDFPDCGGGPLVRGSTDTLQIGPMTDVSDVDPPSGIIGNALRATGYTESTVDFQWRLAPLPGPGEHHVVVRSDDDPSATLTEVATTTLQAWTDPDAPPRYDPVHVWFYRVFLADDCGNRSDD